MEAQVEGPLAAGLLRCGLDAVVVTDGVAEPSGLHISPGGRVVWEKSKVDVSAGVWETDKKFRSELSDIVITTGSFGMDQHPGASIVVNNGFPTTQGGLGSCLGRLGIKYIRFHSLVPSPGPTPTQARATAEYASKIQENPLTRSEFEAPGFGLWADPTLVGYAGTEGFSGSNGRGLRDFSPHSVLEFLADMGTNACPACPQQCLKAYTTSPETPIDGGRVHQLGIGALIAQSNQTEPGILVDFNALCHDLGVEHLVAEEALRGRELSRDTLRADIESAVSLWSPEDPSLLHVKGMPIPPFDPRGNQGLGLGFALNPTGPRYDVLEHDIDFDSDAPWMDRENLGRDFGIPPGGIPMGTLDARRHESLTKLWLSWSGLDALGLCEFAAPPTREMTLEMMGELVEDSVGASFSIEDIWKLGVLRLAILRSCNSELGISAQDDHLPEHFYSTGIADGRLAGIAVKRADFDLASSVVKKEFGWLDVGVDPSSDAGRGVSRVEKKVSDSWMGARL